MLCKLKEKKIVYGLGSAWNTSRLMIHNMVDVVGVCDQVFQKQYPDFIHREELNSYSENILITSEDYYDQIKAELIEKYHVQENRIEDKYALRELISNFDADAYQRDCWIEKQLLQITENAKILDAGAGELKWKKVCSHLQYTAQDICEYKGDGTEGLQTQVWNTKGIDLVCDIIDIPVEDGYFDAVLCTEVFEHIPNAEQAVKELARVLAAGGKLILTAPFISLTHFAPYHYATGFNKYWFEEILPKYNLKIEQITPNGDFYSCIRMELARLPYVIKKYNQDYNVENVLNNASGLIEEMEKLSAVHNRSSILWNRGYMILARKGKGNGDKNDYNKDSI